MGPHNPLVVLQRSLFSRVSVFFSNMGASKKKQRKQKVFEHVRARKQSNHDKISSSKETIPRTTSSRDPRVKETLWTSTQINEYRRRYRKVKKCAHELQAQHHLLVPSGILLVSETAKAQVPVQVLINSLFFFLFLSLNAFIFFFFTYIVIVISLLTVGTRCVLVLRAPKLIK